MKKYLIFLLLLLGITLSCKKEEKTPDVIPVTSISLSKTLLSLTEGESQILTAVVRPSNATYKAVVWASSVASVASVDDSGNVIAISEGNTVISARAGGKIASCSVTVSKKAVPVTGVTLSKTSLSLNIGKTEILVATVSPDNATNKTVTWTSSNPSVASVDSGGKVTARAEGSATITAKVGDKTATCAVTITASAIGGSEGTGEEDWD